MGNFSSGTAYTAETREFYDLAGCSTDASAMDDLVLQVIEGVRTNSGLTRRPPACAARPWVTRSTGSARSRRRPTPAATRERRWRSWGGGSSTLPPPHTGDHVKFRATCFGVGHGTSVCPAKPEYSAKCCYFCCNGGHGTLDCPRLGSGDGRLRRILGDQVPAKFYPPRESRERRFSVDGIRRSPHGHRRCSRCGKTGHMAAGYLAPAHARS